LHRGTLREASYLRGQALFIIPVTPQIDTVMVYDKWGPLSRRSHEGTGKKGPPQDAQGDILLYRKPKRLFQRQTGMSPLGRLHHQGDDFPNYLIGVRVQTT